MGRRLQPEVSQKTCKARLVSTASRTAEGHRAGVRISFPLFCRFLLVDNYFAIIIS